MPKGPFSSISEYAVRHPSSIREIMTLVTDYRVHPEKYPRPLLYLGGGWPQDPPPPILREKLLEIASSVETFNQSSRYGATGGEPELIDLLIEYENKVFGRSKPGSEEIIIGSGSTDQTAAVFLSILDPGSEVIFTRPYYLNYTRQLEIEFQRTIRVKTWDIIKDHRYDPALDDLQELITDKTSLIVITSPGNPDSKIIPEEVYKGVLDIAEDKGIWVILDLAYRAFTFKEPPRYFSQPRRENEIIIATLSKELRIPGWRISYVIADPELVKRINTIEQARILCPSRLVQEVLIRLFSDSKSFAILREFNRKSSEKYSKVAYSTYEKITSEIEGINALKPDGGFYVCFDITAYTNNSKEFCNRLLKEWQVALVPGVDFGKEGWVRLSFAPVVETPEVVDEALERMKQFLGSLRH
ncbi:MAG TPA: pyridoxal phosphate-dependent aminotransferase [Thermoproteales archaeon]|nr:pyridoxal phosphate-dependent aminotransferase [Thermoproteales archaeon]